MNLQQLETAIAVAETGSFSKGAAQLYLSQPHVASFHYANREVNSKREQKK